MNKATLDFIHNHAEAEIYSLSMNAKRFPEVDISMAIRQIEGRRKIREKVPAFYDNENILYPLKLSLEQSSSQLSAIYKKSIIRGSKILIDLTGGFGVDFYFLSSIFEKSYYVESDTELCDLAKHNFNVLNINSFEVYNETAEKFLERKVKADCIFIDPHRRSETGKKVVSLSDCSPDVSILVNQMLHHSPEVLIKLSPMLDIKKALDNVTNVSEVHIVAINNECREVLYKLQRDYTEEPVLYAVNKNKSEIWDQFSFRLSEEINTTYVANPETSTYLYEPNAAILKSGAFKLIAKRFGINKLHRHSHLYTADKVLGEFPGRKFLIIAQYEFSKAEMKKLSTAFPQANLSCKNFPMNTETFRKKYRITDGGNKYIFATTLSDEKQVCLVCEKL